MKVIKSDRKLKCANKSHYLMLIVNATVDELKIDRNESFTVAITA